MGDDIEEVPWSEVGGRIGGGRGRRGGFFFGSFYDS